MTIETNNESDKSKPSLAPQCSLYFDSIHKRWVIRAPNQVVFPDSDSLEVLLLCNGNQSVQQISDKLEQNNKTICGDTTREIIMRFIRRGVLERDA